MFDIALSHFLLQSLCFVTNYWFEIVSGEVVRLLRAQFTHHGYNYVSGKGSGKGREGGCVLCRPSSVLSTFPDNYM